MSQAAENNQDACAEVRREAADRLRRLTPEILSRWCDRIRAEVPAARERSSLLLIDHLPKFLECLAPILAGEASVEEIPEFPDYAGVHGELRAYLPDFSLDEVFVEYAILREVIMEVLEGERPLPLTIRLTLQSGIDRAVRSAVRQYVDATQQELQSSERRLRRLQALSDVALSRLGLEELLRELLERIRRMLAADTAVILLRQDDVLRVRVALGLEEEAEGRVTVSLGDGYAGRIAAAGSPLIVPDTHASEIIRPSLRKRARSLLGVPLVLENAVIGVVHIGTRETRVFTGEDQDFLQLAADRVALAIDRARLFQELRQANERKTQFLAMLAHEMRTPLSAVNSAAYILQEIQVEGRAVKQLEAIQRQTANLARLVEDLMDVSRISRGRIELRRELVDLGTLAAQAVQAVQPLIDARGQEINCTIPEGPLTVDADPVRLNQVIVNLLNNAAKYTEPGGRIWLTIELDDEQVTIRICDTGIGIDPSVLPTLFDLFAQVDPSEAKSHGGLGIGLFLVKRLVELHGGRVAVRSAGVGAGAEFSVQLPLVPKPPD